MRIDQKPKISPKKKFWGRMSCGHPGSFARISRPKISVRALKILEKLLGVDIHDPKAQTSTTLRDFQKLRSDKLWAEFSFPDFRKAPDTFNFLRHVMRAILSVRPKCSHRCVSLKETPLKPVQILKHTTQNSAEQTSMRTKWFKLIGI